LRIAQFLNSGGHPVDFFKAICTCVRLRVSVVSASQRLARGPSDHSCNPIHIPGISIAANQWAPSAQCFDRDPTGLHRPNNKLAKNQKPASRSEQSA
jgi:hypothetical protein